MANVIELSQIERRFGTDPVIEVLRGVNFVVRKREWVSIVGASGSGKSTLLNIIGLLDKPSSGKYSFEGIDVASLSDRQLAGLRSQRIGFVFQSFNLLTHRTVIENVMMAEVYRAGERASRGERAAEALKRVGLSHRLNHSPVHLSGGERQRVAIARAIIGSPAILLCDEPTGNLDSKTTKSVLELFRDLHEKGLTLVMITHSQEVAEYSSIQVKLVDGQLSEYSLKKEIAKRALNQTKANGEQSNEDAEGPLGFFKKLKVSGFYNY